MDGTDHTIHRAMTPAQYAADESENHLRRDKVISALAGMTVAQARWALKSAELAITKQAEATQVQERTP